MPMPFHTLDVFTAKPFAGNPLAVVLDADELDASDPEGVRMQAIAREFNLSETVFVTAPEQSGHHARIRIFTPMHELPFAGHPTVGTACLLAQLAAESSGATGNAIVTLEEKVGAVRCAVKGLDTSTPAATFDLPRLPEPHAHVPATDQLAEVLGLMAADVGFENHVPSGFDAGNPFTMVPVASLDALRRAQPDLARWSDVFATDTTGDPYLYCRDCVHAGAAFHARMFAPAHGIPEDPATGSAVATFAGTIMQFDAPVDGTHTFHIEQGYEMGRPSDIHLELTVESGALSAARITGQAVRVSEGLLRI